jgi:3-methyl-2-oxobutanoate hydroxymethyltransferase
VKVEGGERRMELISRLVEAEIPVVGHVGLTPQSVNALGGFHVQGKTEDAARQVERDARAVEAAGAFAIVLESMPREVAARITENLHIPTIGIGAGPDCDGQVLVFHDFVGLTSGHAPKFVRRYADLSAEISRAVSDFSSDVRSGKFPSDAESYHSPAELREQPPARNRT